MSKKTKNTTKTKKTPIVVDTTDVRAEDHGSLWLLYADTDAATDWIDEHVGGETTYYGEGLVVEPRYAMPMLCGMAEEGLKIDINGRRVVSATCDYKPCACEEQ